MGHPWPGKLPSCSSISCQVWNGVWYTRFFCHFHLTRETMCTLTCGCYLPSRIAGCEVFECLRELRLNYTIYFERAKGRYWFFIAVRIVNTERSRLCVKLCMVIGQRRPSSISVMFTADALENHWSQFSVADATTAEKPHAPHGTHVQWPRITIWEHISFKCLFIRSREVTGRAFLMSCEKFRW